MCDIRFKNRYRIPSARAAWHDYNGGAYFVTICTHNREHYLGEITNGVMHLSEMGQIAAQCMDEVHCHFPHVDVPIYVIMPNHVHAIIIIDDGCSVETHNHASPSQAETHNHASPSQAETHNHASPSRVIHSQDETQNFASLQPKREFGPQSRNLASVIRGFKIGVKKYANAHGLPFAWQSRFHDHIIRNADEMNRIVSYLENNVASWETDKFCNP